MSTTTTLTEAEREAFERLQQVARAVRRCEPAADGAVLIALCERAGGRMSTAELLATLAWEKSRLSHHLTRMEQRGLVVREQCQADLRAWFVVATDAGRAAGAAALDEHVAAVRGLLVAASAGGEVPVTEAGEARCDKGGRHGGDGDERGR